MVNGAALGDVQRERTPTQQHQNPPSNFPVVQTQAKAQGDASGTFPHSNSLRGINLPSPASVASPLRSYPPSPFPHNNYYPYTIYHYPQFPNTPPQAYPYAHPHAYASHSNLESPQYLQSPLGFSPILQAHSPLEGRQLPLQDSPGMYHTPHVASAHSPLFSPVSSSSHNTPYTNHLLYYHGPGTPYHYNHAYQPNTYHWYCASHVPPGFTEGIPILYQFPPHQHASPSNLESQFYRVSISSRFTPHKQPTATLAAPLPVSSALRQSQVSTPATTSPVHPERRASSLLPLNTLSHSHSEHPLMRRPYHPNPPAHRSEWVMWIGNVPDDATHDELWKFLTCLPSPGDERPEPMDSGVSSIFLISHSNCAFVNYNSEESLWCAITRFNGQQVRPHEWRCPRLVCRARCKEDDLRAGVGGQRGIGVHTRYVRELRQKEKKDGAPSEDDRNSGLSSESKRLSTLPSMSSDEEAAMVGPRWQPGQCVRAPSSSSYSSTNSSFLSRYFPKRFFILKSLSQFDLDLSVENGLWATQKHNEAILDQAYRTSTEVILIFGVNKSGEFYGYARMAGRILHGERSVSWASHVDTSPTALSSSSQGQAKQNTNSPNPLVPANETFFTPSKHLVESPLPITPSPRGTLRIKPSPAVSHPPWEFSVEPPALKSSLGAGVKVESVSAHLPNDFAIPFHSVVLDKNAPIRAIRNKANTDDTKIGAHALQPVREENTNTVSGDGDGDGVDELANEALKSPATDDAGNDGRQTWGQPFKVEWLCTDRLPFRRVRHLRNPWNRDREIKVSRDGTELEPGVGQQLVEEWQTLAAAPPTA